MNENNESQADATPATPAAGDAMLADLEGTYWQCVVGGKRTSWFFWRIKDGAVECYGTDLKWKEAACTVEELIADQICDPIEGAVRMTPAEVAAQWPELAAAAQPEQPAVKYRCRKCNELIPARWCDACGISGGEPTGPPVAEQPAKRGKLSRRITLALDEAHAGEGLTPATLRLLEDCAVALKKRGKWRKRAKELRQDLKVAQRYAALYHSERDAARAELTTVDALAQRYYAERNDALAEVERLKGVEAQLREAIGRLGGNMFMATPPSDTPPEPGYREVVLTLDGKVAMRCKAVQVDVNMEWKPGQPAPGWQEVE